MKRNYNSVLAMLIAGLFFISCEGEEGPPGPQGNQGDQGEQGPQGDPGADGADGSTPYVIDGFIKGTLTGTRRDGTTPINESFDFQAKYDTEGFKDEGGGFYSLSLARSTAEAAENDNFYQGVYMDLIVFDRDGTPNIEVDYFEIDIEKEISICNMLN